MKVRFVQFDRSYNKIKPEIDAEMQRVLGSGDLILRKDVEDFEKNLAEFVGTKYAVGVNSGTDALYFCLKALGIGPGDEVITVGHTFIATIEVIQRCGATPILIDVREDGLMDPFLIVNAVTPNTKAIIPVHLSGKVCDMKTIMDISAAKKIEVIEDAAQALGAKDHGMMAGSIGKAGCFSFYPAKILGAFGDAGGVTTNDEEFAEKIRLYRNHWNVKQTSLAGGPPPVMEWSGNSRLDNIQAVVLNVKFKHLNEYLSRRREIAERYLMELKDLPPTFVLPMIQREQVFQEFIVRSIQMNDLATWLSDHGVETLVRDTTPNHRLKGLGLEHFSLPMTDELAITSLRLPVWPDLTDEEVSHVIETVKGFYSQANAA